MIKVGIVSLGCDKNRVDAEYLLSLLKGEGYIIESDSSKCDILIINTCAFIESARVESIDTILEFAKLKEQGLKKLIVTGCLSQKYAKEIFDDLPEADAFIAPDAYGDLKEILQRTFKNERVLALKPKGKNICMDLAGRVLTTPGHYAYLKIAEGCNNGCSYCTIPSIKGKYRSKGILELVNECGALNNGKIKEIILVAQDVTRYGFDLYNEYKIVELIQELSKLENIERIRLLYCYPELISGKLISEIKNNGKVCKYLDIPFQHVSDSVLKNMRRRSSLQSSKDLIANLRKQIPDIAIRSTFITGFPGETEEDFQLLYDFINTYKLENAGFFKYSKEEGTLAADMPNQIEEDLKEFRYNELYKLQQKIAFEKNKNCVGKTFKVLCDGFDVKRKQFFGRSYGQAPDADGVVYIEGENIKTGEFYNTKIIKSLGYDLCGKPV